MIRRKLMALLATLEAACWLAVAWLALDVLPGRLYRRLLPPARPAQGPAALPQAVPPSVLRVTRAIWRASRVAPFRSVCFHRAIAARFMLQRRGMEALLHYGVLRESRQSLKAHVWVTCRGTDVMGGADSAGYTEVAHFHPGTPL